MSIRTFAAAAVFAVSFAGVAFARDTIVTATLAAPQADARVVADSAVWNCADASCRAIPQHAVSVHGCRDFVRRSHTRVTAYGSEDRQLNAEELARCNNDAAPAALQTNAAH
ncbi:MAG: hypothetical protein QM759_07250 [Terricaulis sp.]